MLSRLPLPLILLLQVITSLLALHNTAFQDEGLYLLAGQQIFLNWMGKTPYLEPYGLYFSGYPSFYPVIGGILDFLGGLEAARLFSLLCMLIVTTCVYFMTVQLFDRKSALIAACLRRVSVVSWTPGYLRCLVFLFPGAGGDALPMGQ